MQRNRFDETKEVVVVVERGGEFFDELISGRSDRANDVSTRYLIVA